MYGDTMSVKGRHVGFETANRNKRSLTLDLKKEKGRQILYDLIKISDVFSSNYRPSILGRLGADPATIRKVNPRIICAIASAYGPVGTEEGRAFDVIGLARSGLMWTMGNRESTEPTPFAGAMCDQVGSLTTAFGIISALFGRERLGIAQDVETSLVGSSICLNAFAINTALLRGRAWARHSREHSKNPLSNYYRCRDNKWILLSEQQSDRFWTQFCDGLGLEKFKSDPRFVSSLKRRDHCEELIQALDALFATKTRDEWLAIFRERHLELACSPIYDVNEAVQDRQVLENEYIVGFDHPVLGPIQEIGYPVRFSQTPAKIQREAPEHGQHTEEVLQELLGYSWEDVAQLREEGVV